MRPHAALLRGPDAVPRRPGGRRTPVGESLMPHGAGDVRRARAAAHGSSQPGAGPRGRRRLGSVSSGLRKRRKVRLTATLR